MRRLVLAVLCGIAAVPPGGGARAQETDVRPLIERLDRLERDMNMLQRQVYHGGGAPVAVTSTDSQSALGNEVRIGQLEEQMRMLNGQLEEANYNIDQLKHRIDKLSSDLDVRFSELERGGAPPAAGEMAPPPPPTRGPQPLSHGGNNLVPPPPGRPGILGTIPAGPPGSQYQEGPPPMAAAAPQLPAPAGASLPNGTPRQQYDYAFGLLRQANYPAAEQALRAFVQRYPNDDLAGNAQYWLGKTYFVRENYVEAATAFAEGYKRYPRSGKAADNLLELGMSLGNLKRTDEACLAFARLERDFPSAPSGIKERASAEKKRLGCRQG